MKFCLVLMAAPLLAHDLYLMPERFAVSPGERIVVGIHNGDSFPDSDSPPVLARVKDPMMWAGGNAYNMTNLRTEEKRGLVDVIVKQQGTPLLAVRTAANVLELDAQKFHEYLVEDGLEHILEWRKKNGEAAKPGKERYSKFAKSLLVSGRTDDTWKRRLGHAIEFVPEQNPYAAKAGGSVPFVLLVRGKPAGDIRIELARARDGAGEVTVLGRTDANGRMVVPLTTPGIYRLHAIHIERCTEPTVADWESFWATFTFEVR
ncbi:MAG: DUF4198 domain-containing protein [Bryobacteraceae bacterium]|nr:DUF4198 domain-containing protein [Bryobacteraceae bacterium]